MIGYALTGSFCTIDKSLNVMGELVSLGLEILPIMSDNAYNTDTRFALAIDVREKINRLSGREIIHSIVDAEPIGPKINPDAMIICPCTGNTLAKIANGITDTPVCMAAKSHLRNDKPLIIALATNDALSGNLKNIATLLSRKNVYFVPMIQDDPEKKPHSLVADFSLVKTTLKLALEGKSMKKIFL